LAGQGLFELVAVTVNVMVWHRKAGNGLVGFGKVCRGMTMQFSDDLKPGDIISRAAVETGYSANERRDPVGFQLVMLRAMQDLQKHLRKIHQRELSIRIQAEGLVILTDVEAADYNPKRFRDGMRLMRRAHRRLMAVDASKLPPAQREAITATICKQAQQLSMLRVKTESSELVAKTERKQRDPKVIAR
jgi:hypothetical protein